MRIERNKPCPCGSGKKYKHCCYMEEFYFERLNRKLMNGELPFRAEVSSDTGTEVSMKVSDVSIQNTYGRNELLNNEVELSINGVSGDKMESKAAISLPQDGSSGEIILEGNASVNSDAEYLKLKLENGKKMRAENSEKIFANIRISKQRDAAYEYFDILFGEKGRKEEYRDGKKNRPHLAFYPDGNGKYVRLAEYKCSIKSTSEYINEGNFMIPKTIDVELDEYDERLIFEFSFDLNSKCVTVKKIYFCT